MRSSSKSDIEVALVSLPEEREAIFALRMRVFVEEQRVPAEEELDAYDVTATHFLARVDDARQVVPDGIVGTARLLNRAPGTAKVGRVAVEAAFRRRGIGEALMRAIEKHAAENGVRLLELEAQLHAIPFYERLGYLAEGGIFFDAGIEHRFMSKDLT